MNKTQVMKQLKAMGTAQNRKVYARHGLTGSMFGVSYANLGALRKQIKIDQKLAEQLWATGNHDARALAVMVADPSQMTARKLDAWAADAGNRGAAAALSNLAALAPTAHARVAKWTRSRNEWISCAGWHTLASLARDDESLGDAAIDPYLMRIEAEIHEAKNYTRYAMNNALISIGISRANLRKKVLAAAKRIGVVEVDHGPTSCKTPDAVPYIKKAVARQANKTAGARRK